MTLASRCFLLLPLVARIMIGKGSGGLRSLRSRGSCFAGVEGIEGDVALEVFVELRVYDTGEYGISDSPGILIRLFAEPTSFLC